nr:type II secretion system protein N [Pseudomonas sp. R-28-1W-6]
MSATGTRVPGWLRRHGVTGLCILVVIAMSQSLSWQALDLVRVLRATPPAPTAAPVAPQAQLALDALQDLFGTPAQARSDQPAPPTSLQLTLLGSFVNPDSQRSTALIQVAGGKPQRLTVGDPLNAGVRLQAVHQDHVVLSRNGREESLHFPRQRTPAATPRSTQPMAQPPITEQQHEQLQGEDVQLLQQRIAVLRQQMEDDGAPAAPTEATEVTEANP